MALDVGADVGRSLDADHPAAVLEGAAGHEGDGPEARDEGAQHLLEARRHDGLRGPGDDRRDGAVDVAEQGGGARRARHRPEAVRQRFVAREDRRCVAQGAPPSSDKPGNSPTHSGAGLVESLPDAPPRLSTFACARFKPRRRAADEMAMASRQRDKAGEAPGGRARAMRADPYLKSMLLGLIEDSYLHTGTFTQFAAEVLQVIAYAVTVPVAFTEGFLKSYLSIERVVEEEDGRIKIIPKAGASVEDMIRDVDEITAQVDPGAVFNPVVRTKLDAVHQTSSKAMKWDLNQLSRMDDQELMEVLREMQAESERIAASEPEEDPAADAVRAKLDTIRRNVRQYQAQHAAQQAAQDAQGAQPAPPGESAG